MRRSGRNPILTRADIPDRHPALRDVTSVFNPGAVRFGDDILLLLRVQNRGRETFFLKAVSRDGVDFRIDPSPIVFRGIEKVEEPVYHCYDARITRIEDRFYVFFAMDMDGRCSLGLAVTGDFETYDFIGIVSKGDVRNGVLFPEKIDGRFLRLDRPNKVRVADGPVSGSDIHLSESQDLIEWRDRGVVAQGDFTTGTSSSVRARRPSRRTTAGFSSTTASPCTTSPSTRPGSCCSISSARSG
jgi:beta-1,4-mannooligosaccharide/beta-1,4-mannosyl-N-acetylglucosamine phosphorylase